MAGDVHFASVKTLLLCNGVNNGTTFTDSSSYARSTTVFNETKLTTTDPKFGSACATFDGSADIIQLNGTDQALSGDWSVDLWAKWASAPTVGQENGLITALNNPKGSTHYAFFTLLSSGTTAIRLTHGASNTVITGHASGGEGSGWHHLAWDKSGNTVYQYFDGTLKNTSGFFSGTLGSSTVIPLIGYNYAVGAIGGASLASWGGQMDCIRITDGVARWAGSNFTPPTSEADYLPASNISPLLGGHLVGGGLLLRGLAR